MRPLLLALLLTSAAAAQTIPDTQAATAVQQMSISRNAKLFTGRICTAWGISTAPVPDDVSDALRKQTTTATVKDILDQYAQTGVKVTTLRWTADGGAEVYVKEEGRYRYVAALSERGRRYTVTFSCLLK